MRLLIPLATTPLLPSSATDLSVGTHELTPAGGAADDYEFTYVSGTLNVTDVASDPSNSNGNSSSNNSTNNNGINNNGTNSSQKKHKSHKKRVLPNTSDASVVLPSVSMIAAAGAMAAGILLCRRV